MLDGFVGFVRRGILSQTNALSLSLVSTLTIDFRKGTTPFEHSFTRIPSRGFPGTHIRTWRYEVDLRQLPWFLPPQSLCLLPGLSLHADPEGPHTGCAKHPREDITVFLPSTDELLKDFSPIKIVERREGPSSEYLADGVFPPDFFPQIPVGSATDVGEANIQALILNASALSIQT